ncbi:MAG: peptidase penicillin-insensitive murein endopeptidase, partial [Rickettsiaceae bacterium]|nr:peptidase penicillin-insensitive murein endopeptidase [Rickettsiaceae bacterium]
MKNLFYILLLLLISCAPSHKVNQYDWASAKIPTSNSSQVYGSYAAGCMDGAAPLPFKGEGYEVVNGARNRFYGQPAMVNFLQKYSLENYRQNGQKLYISDIAQPRGGPIIHGHGSHQVGLDVDIWYGREGELPVDLVNKGRTSIDQSQWQKFDVGILKNAAGFAEVERIFVDPYIKKQLCAEHKGEAWLNKLRPWRYHSDHFHIRLACPKGDRTCVSQA